MTVAGLLTGITALLALWTGLRDARTARVRPLECLALAACAGAAVLAAEGPAPRALLAHALGALVSLAVLLLAAWFRPGEISGGDAWGLAAYGWATGWPGAAWMLGLGSALALAWAGLVILRRRRRRPHRIPWRMGAPLLPGFALAAALLLALETLP